MSSDRTWYTVYAYRTDPAAAHTLNATMAGLGFRGDGSAPEVLEWQADDHPVGRSQEIAEELRRLAARHRFAFEVYEEATELDMGHHYTYLPDQDLLHQGMFGNDGRDYLPVERVVEAIDTTTSREELVQTLEAASGIQAARGLQAWHDGPRDPPATA